MKKEIYRSYFHSLLFLWKGLIFLLCFLFSFDIETNLSVFGAEIIKIEDVQATLQNNGKGFLAIGSYVVYENGSKCQVLTECQQCSKYERHYAECKQTGKLQKLSCTKVSENKEGGQSHRHLLFQNMPRSEQRSTEERSLEEKENDNDENTNEKAAKEAEKREAEKWFGLDSIDPDEMSDIGLKYKVKSKEEIVAENGAKFEVDLMQQDGSQLSSGENVYSNETTEEDMYDIYIPCYRTVSEDIVTLVRFQTAMAIIGGIAMYMVRKQSIKSLSLFDRRKLHNNQNSG